MMAPLKGYCEHNAHRPWLRAWQAAKQIELVHFPYDPASFNRTSAKAVIPSAATWNDMNLTYDQAGDLRWCDFTGSAKLPQIIAIVGKQNHADTLHIDSAYKSGCAFFLTGDKGDIIRNHDRLETLLGIRFFHPDDHEAEIKALFAAAGLSLPVPRAQIM